MFATIDSNRRIRPALVQLVCLLLLIGRIAAPILPMPALAQAMMVAAGICHAGSASDSDPASGHHEVCQDCDCCSLGPLAALTPTNDISVSRRITWMVERSNGLIAAIRPPAAAGRPFQSRAPPLQVA